MEVFTLEYCIMMLVNHGIPTPFGGDESTKFHNPQKELA